MYGSMFIAGYTTDDTPLDAVPATARATHQRSHSLAQSDMLSQDPRATVTGHGDR
jgi:hypothetical protein